LLHSGAVHRQNGKLTEIVSQRWDCSGPKF